MPEQLTKASKTAKGRYVAGLDGLRALAVLAVIAYHLDARWAPGGFAGVELFFVLSGYLITDLLMSEWKRNHKINMVQFWIRRFRRLLPAMLSMIVVVVCAQAVLNPSRLMGLQGDVGAAVLYLSNWWLIVNEVSYFETFGPASPFGHLWSLAVEEQFYLLWPLLMALLLCLTKRRGLILLFILAGAALSAAAMFWMYVPGTDPSRVYYGTDTRAFGLLAGAALAVLWPKDQLGGFRLDAAPFSKRSIAFSKAASPVRKVALELCGAVALSMVLLMVFFVGEYDPFLYRGGMLLLSVSSAVLIAVVAHPASLLGRGMSWQPLRWLGTRSYGLYLWHYPVIVMTTPAVQTAGRPLLQSLAQVAASLLLAELSWRFIEKPIRSGGLRTLVQALQRSYRRRLEVVACTGMLVLLSMFYFGYINVQANNTLASSAGDEEVQKGQELNGEGWPKENQKREWYWKDLQQLAVVIEDGSAEDLQQEGTVSMEDSVADGSNGLEPDRTDAPKVTEVPYESDLPNDPNLPDKSAPAAGYVSIPEGSDITVIGDSVILGAQPYLEEELPGIRIDAEIGRQFSEAYQIVDELREAGSLGNQVIIQLGNNGLFSDQQLAKLLDSLQDVEQVLLLNTRVPRRWQEPVNEVLSRGAEAYANVFLVDWFAASTGSDEYFENDGIHLKPQGAQAYAALVLQALNPTQGSGGD